MCCCLVLLLVGVDLLDEGVEEVADHLVVGLEVHLKPPFLILVKYSIKLRFVNKQILAAFIHVF